MNRYIDIYKGIRRTADIGFNSFVIGIITQPHPAGELGYGFFQKGVENHRFYDLSDWCHRLSVWRQLPA